VKCLTIGRHAASLFFALHLITGGKSAKLIACFPNLLLPRPLLFQINDAYAVAKRHGGGF
jgi:hypothetical protein